jgi:hypothetical protein
VSFVVLEGLSFAGCDEPSAEKTNEKMEKTVGNTKKLSASNKKAQEVAVRRAITARVGGQRKPPVKSDDADAGGDKVAIALDVILTPPCIFYQ